jgi:hypothetical protein
MPDEQHTQETASRTSPAANAATPLQRVGVGFLCVIAGLPIMAAACSLPAAERSAPQWVVFLAGAMFSLLGMTLILPPSAERVIRLLAASGVTCFAAVFSWVAFGPGVRQFSTSVSIGIGTTTATGSEMLGRILFGAGAVMLIAFSLWAWSRFMLAMLGKRRG